MKPDLTQEDFSRAMQAQLDDDHQDVRNIGLAQGTILQFMYPLEGNETAIGMNYKDLPDQIAAVELAKEANKIVLAGPVNLVQGGEAIIARMPITLTNPSTLNDEWWGFVSIVLNLDSVLAGAGLEKLHETLEIAIQGRDGLGAQGDIFYGSASVFNQSPAIQTLDLPHGSWQIAATPKNGWANYKFYQSTVVWLYLLASCTILLLAGFLYYTFSEHKKSLATLRKERNLFAEGPVFSLSGAWIKTTTSS